MPTHPATQRIEMWAIERLIEYPGNPQKMMPPWIAYVGASTSSVSYWELPSPLARFRLGAVNSVLKDLSVRVLETPPQAPERTRCARGLAGDQGLTTHLSEWL